LLANLVFRPLSIRLEKRLRDRQAQLHLLFEAVTMMHDHTHSKVVREHFRSFQPEAETEVERHAPRVALARIGMAGEPS
jgi:flagellar motor component MotA